jgi:hypothetical protein
MNKEEIVEGNKLIAKFMGWVIDDSFPDKGRTYRSPKGNIELETTFKYHVDWNHLMAVVEEIEKEKGVTILLHPVGCEIYVCGKEISNKNSDTKIKATWLSVVEFIKWYNEQNKK